MNVDRSVVASMIPTLFLPFNLTKASLNASLVLILYKPVSTALKAARVLPRSSSLKFFGEDVSVKKKKIFFSLSMTLVGVVVMVICIVVFFLVLGGEFVPFWK